MNPFRDAACACTLFWPQTGGADRTNSGATVASAGTNKGGSGHLPDAATAGAAGTTAATAAGTGGDVEDDASRKVRWSASST